MCPVNVHWHLGSEHVSTGEYDSAHTANPPTAPPPLDTTSVRQQARCIWWHHLPAAVHEVPQPHHQPEDEHDWKYCKKMVVGDLRGPLAPSGWVLATPSGSTSSPSTTVSAASARRPTPARASWPRTVGGVADPSPSPPDCRPSAGLRRCQRRELLLPRYAAV